MTSPGYQEWVEEARAVPIATALGRRAAGLKRASGGRELVGPCPVCKGRDRFSVHFGKGLFNCRGSGQGGDAIALVQYLDSCDFNQACETLTGRPKPGAEPMTDAEREAWARRRAERDRRAAEAERDAEAKRRHFRELERRKAHDIWLAGAWLAEDDPVRRYLAHRRVSAPGGAHLRYGHAVPYYVADTDPKKPPRLLFTGPAMLGAITDPEGFFRGVHVTWLDPRLLTGDLPEGANGKREIVDPGSGEVLPAKKVRGSAGGNHIELVRVRDPHTLYVGEGIETTLAVRDALLEGEVPLDGCTFRAGISLGNLAGKATVKVLHPTERRTDRNGRPCGPLRVPGPRPDLASTALRIPDSVKTLFLLGDGDSEPFTTRMALERGATRHARRTDGGTRQVFIPMAPAGTDFNKLRMEAAA